MLLALVAVGALLMSLTLCAVLIPVIRRAGVVCKDHNKRQAREIPQMGGLAVILGFCGGLLIALGLSTFAELGHGLNVESLLAAVATVLMVGFIGLIDDLLGMPQLVKAITPAIAAIPLVVIRSGVTIMRIPFLGPIDLGFLYVFALVPLGVTGAANAVNILAGFDGMEAGMGLVALSSLAVISGHLGSWTALVLLVAGIGAVLGFLIFNLSLIHI